MFKKFLNQIRKPRVKYEPLIKVLISRDAILHNFRTYQGKYPALKLAPVLKSNAYGHGLVEVATILEPEKPPFLVVDSFYEALVLRRAMVKSNILVIGYSRDDLILRKTLKDIAFTIISLESLRNLAGKLTHPARLHLKVDTGMHRQGLLPGEIPEAAKLIKSNPLMILEGVCSHFADADNPDQTFTKQQIASWNEISSILKRQFGEIKYFHLAATAGLHYTSQIAANAARLGLGLYGINWGAPSQEIELKPALEMRSVISSLKPVPRGEKIGYGITFETPAPLTLATVPAGYHEGIDLRLSNTGVFQVRGKSCAIAGRVSMNITTIDVTGAAGARIGEDVIMISNEPALPNSVENIAKICHTIPYEILVHIPPSLRRVII